jgi:L-alanine-DL-glutamate epimerase-like enolase superfamily enzyme
MKQTPPAGNIGGEHDALRLALRRHTMNRCKRMRITNISEHAVKLEGNIANALVNFSDHTISVVIVHTDVVRAAKPVVGIAFNSIGRYAQSGILKDRMIPRILKAEADDLLNDQGDCFDPARVLACAMKNEKPGGHGDRAAAGALELAIWDLNAKLADEPAYATIARHYGRTVASTRVPVYAAGGYYYPDGGISRLKDEMLSYRDMGFNAFKMKIGGDLLKEDLARIDAVLTIAGEGSKLAVVLICKRLARTLRRCTHTGCGGMRKSATPSISI